MIRDYLLDTPTWDMSDFQRGIPATYEFFLPIAITILRNLGLPEDKLRGLHRC